MKCFFKDALSTFLIRLYGAEHLINYLSDCERETTTEIGRKGMFLFYDTLYIYIYICSLDHQPTILTKNQKPTTTQTKQTATSNKQIKTKQNNLKANTHKRKQNTRTTKQTQKQNKTKQINKQTQKNQQIFSLI